MAVIKQQSQFFNKPIGVVRASQGGAKVAEAISNIADYVTDETFKVAASEAKERGTKAAIAQKTSDVVNIDPVTGRPIAYSPPSGYGSIAAQSYQDLIDTRFQDSVASEMQLKGAEIASSASSSAEYRDRMSAYVGAMYENAKSEDGELNAYGRILQESGEQYVTSTYAAMRKKEVEAERAAVLKQNQMNSFQQLDIAKDSISEGVDAQTVTTILDREQKRNEDLFNMPNGISFSEYKTKVKEINGLRSLQANSELVSLFSGLGADEKVLVKQALSNPSMVEKVADAIGSEELAGLVISARRSESASSIISGLDAISEIDKDIEESAVDVAVHNIGVTADSDIHDLVSEVNKGSVEINAQVKARVFEDFAIKVLDSKDFTQDQMDRISNILNSSTPDYNELSSIVGDKGQQVAYAIRNLSADDRSELNSDFVDRLASTGRIEANEEDRLQQSFLNQIAALRTSDNLIADRDKIANDIASSNLPNTKSLLTSLDEDFARYAIDMQRGLDIGFDRYDEMMQAISSGSEFVGETDGEKEAYELLSRAMTYSPSATTAAMSTKSSSLFKINKDQVEELTLNSYASAAMNGMSIPEERLEEVGERIFGEGPVSIADLAANPNTEEALMFSQGVVLPQVAKALGAALTSNNTGEIEAAIKKFEQGFNTTATLASGDVVPADSMRGALSESDYAMYSALVFANRNFQEDPVALLTQLRNYDGDIEADLKTNLKIPDSAGLDRAFGDAYFSPQYKREIINAAKIALARGGRVDQETFDSIITLYTEGMAEDDRIFGPVADNRTIYSLNSFANASEVIANEAELVNLIVSSGEYTDIIRGGTITDSAIEGLGLFSGRIAYARAVGIIANIMGDMDPMVKNARRDAIARGDESIGLDLKYRPNIRSFNAGMPSWDVGFETELGFEPITINGQMFTFDINNRESDDLASFSNQAYVATMLVRNSGATDADVAKVDIKYLATLDHVTEESFRDSKEFYRYQRMLDGEDAIEIFQSARRELESKLTPEGN